MRRNGTAAVIALAAAMALVAGAGCKSGRKSAGKPRHGGQHAHHGEKHAGHKMQPGDPSVPSSFAEEPPLGTRARCPVSGEVFTVNKKSVRLEYNSRHYVLCCNKCMSAFESDPQRYADPD